MQVLVMVGQLLLGLSILVGLHELGHLLAARAFGMRVEEYSIGFPPKILGFRLGETVYSLGAIPLGGFVRISGMIDESLDSGLAQRAPEPWEFRSKPAWQRLIVMLGGIIVNVITGIVIYVALVYNNGETYLPAREARYGIVAHPLAQELGLQTGDRILEINGRPLVRFSDVASPDLLLGTDGFYTVERGGQILTIQVPNNFIERLAEAARQGQMFISPIAPFAVARVRAGTPAAQAGLTAGDRIVQIDGQSVEFFHQLQEVLAARKNQHVSLLLDRQGERITTEATITEEGRLGFEPQFLLREDRIDYTLPESISRGSVMAFDVVWLNVKTFGKIFRGEVRASNAVSGPIAMAQDLYGGVWDWTNFWRNTGLLSMVLAFMNLLPIPALDGGHVMFLSYEMLTRRRPSERFLMAAQRVGMVLLLSLMVFAIGNDVIKRLF